MSWFGLNKIMVSDLKCRAEDLQRENDKLKSQVESLANTVEYYKEIVVGEYNNASFTIDWKAINAFSVERMPDGAKYKTVVGFMLTEPVVSEENGVVEKDVVREWTYYCSHAEHERLVADFNKTVLGK